MIWYRYATPTTAWAPPRTGWLLTPHGVTMWPAISASTRCALTVVKKGNSLFKCRHDSILCRRWTRIPTEANGVAKTAEIHRCRPPALVAAHRDSAQHHPSTSINWKKFSVTLRLKEKWEDSLPSQYRFYFSSEINKQSSFPCRCVQGVGGTVQYPKGFLKSAFDLIRNHGGVCVSDEVLRNL